MVSPGMPNNSDGTQPEAMLALLLAPASARRVGAGTRQHSDDDPDDVAARHLPVIFFGELPLARHDASEFAPGDRRRFPRPDRPHHLGHGEDADQRRDRLA